VDDRVDRLVREEVLGLVGVAQVERWTGRCLPVIDSSRLTTAGLELAKCRRSDIVTGGNELDNGV
jgi:hypothetical protein